MRGDAVRPLARGFGGRHRPRRAAFWVALSSLALPAGLYLATLYPGIGDRAASGDAVEFQTVGRVLGVAHEPGYPQYVLISFLWSWLPLPLTVATKINLLSSVFALAAGGFLLATARAIGNNVTAAVLCSWIVLLAPDLWLLATQAEVYTLHVLWVTVFFWAALRWKRSGVRRDLLVLLFSYGLAFGNHLTMIALLPALAFLLLARQPRLATRPAAWAWAGAAAAAGASQYLLLVWRSYVPHPTLLERFPLRAGAGELLAYITGDRFVEKHWLPLDGGEWGARIGEALGHGLAQLTPLFALVAVFGSLSGWRRERARTAFLLLAASSVLLFAAFYDIRDWLLYCIPAWVAVALLAAGGMARLLERLPRLGLGVAVVVGLTLAPRIVNGVDELRVPSNPADLTRVLPLLPSGARVIPAGGQRLARLHADYYRHAAGLESAREIRFLAARQDVLHKALHLKRRPLFFRSPTVVKIFSGRLIDSRVWPDGPTADPVWVIGTDEPLTGLGLTALPGPALELTVRGERRTLSDERDFYLHFVGARDGRSRGLEALDAEGQGMARARRLLEALPEGDVVTLLVPRLRDDTRAPLDELLAGTGLATGDTAHDGRLVAVWRHRGDPGTARIWPDPDDGASWAVALNDL